jgi:flagellar M-ring protein FliF
MKGLLSQLAGRFSLRHRILILAAAVAVVAGLVTVTRWRRERDFKPLYTQLAAEDASAVIAKLRESGAEYRLSDNGATVLAPSARIAELRLQLAGVGLPRAGRAGFELFDKTNFGVTDFAEHINYRRALEGELERSVMSLAEVEQARVHVTFPKDSVFVEQRQPAKASVMLKLRPLARLAQPNVLAIAHLVSSAVEGLAPDAVSILDMQGNLLSRPRRAALDGEPPNEAMLEFKQQVERDIQAKIHSTLEPLLGADRFRAGVSVECDFTSGEQSEEVFDPTRSVMTASQKTEDTTGAALASGVPGTASALPRPTSRPASSSNGVSRRTENVTYQTSRVVKHTKLRQGAVKRMSLAVLVDHTVRWEGNRRVVEPPPPERLKSIRDLLAAATGLNTERGDQLIVETLPFETTLAVPPPEAPKPTQKPTQPPPVFALPVEPRVVAIAGAALGALLLLSIAAALVVRRGRKKRRACVTMQPALPAPEASFAAAVETGQATGDPAKQQLEARLAEQQALQQKLEAEALSALKLPPVTTKKAEVLAKHLVESARKDPTAAAHVLRTWLYDVDR